MPEKQTKVENFEAYILKFLKIYKTVQIHFYILKKQLRMYLLYGPIFTNNQWGLLDKFLSSMFYLLLTIFMV